MLACGKITFFTLGCRVNHYETSVLEDTARARGLTVAAWGEPADIALINSCALTALACAKTRQNVRIFMRANPEARVAVCGCYADTDAQSLANIDGVGWIIGKDAKTSAVDIILENPPTSPARFYGGAARAGFERVAETGVLSDRMNLKIQDGCDNFCSYCIIPRARGLPSSRDFAGIVADAENLAARGVREIILTGINISKFSTPNGGLVELIDRLDGIEALKRLRLGSLEAPNFPLEAVLERAGDSSHKLMPHLHISAQSLSDKVLEAMRRRYCARDFLSIVEKIKSAVPDMSVGTDIICGHPEEGEAEFDETRRRMVSCGLSYAHVFTFSPRPKTLAASMKNVAPAAVRKERSDALRIEARAMYAKFAASQFGKVRPVMFENQRRDGTYLGYTDNYIQLRLHVAESGLKNCVRNVELSQANVVLE